MEFLNWLQDLGADMDLTVEGFQSGPMYVFVCVVLPVVFGLFVGFGLRFIERVFGVEIGQGGGH
jgi:hypothetical protein